MAILARTTGLIPNQSVGITPVPHSSFLRGPCQLDDDDDNNNNNNENTNNSKNGTVLLSKTFAINEVTNESFDGTVGLYAHVGGTYSMEITRESLNYKTKK